MFTRPFARTTPAASSSTAYGSLPTCYVDAERRREHVGELLEALARARTPRARRAGRRSRARRRASAASRARDRAQRPAAASCTPGRSARGRRAACCARRRARAPSVTAPPREVLGRRPRAPPRRPPARVPCSERAGRRDALVEHADLPRERDDDAGEHDHRDPEDDVRDDERLGHRRAAQPREPGAQREQPIGGGRSTPRRARSSPRRP